MERKLMPTEYHPPAKPGGPDWGSLLGLVAAFLILVATTIGYLRNWETREQAEMRAYMATGITPPRESGASK
jgi:hypothetical protein